MPRILPRCPHCASPKLDGGVCRACGRRADEVPELPRLDGLELTQHEPRVLPRRPDGAASTDKKVCQRCSVPNPPGRELCLACGDRL